MIHVQIASQITAQGVSGVRWVLVETVDAVQAQQAAPAVALAAPAMVPPAAPASATPTADGLRLGVLKALVVALGLGAALWTALVQVGPPDLAASPKATLPPPAAQVVLPGAVPKAMPNVVPKAQQAVPPAASAPVAVPARPAAPAASAASAASDGLPRLTAGL